jgi:hypothetical protein
MKARIDYYCLPSKKGADYDVENIHLVVDLPFIPTVGMDMKFTKDGDFATVSDVMYDHTDEVTPLCVGLEEPNPEQVKLVLRPWKEMKAQGWLLG